MMPTKLLYIAIAFAIMRFMEVYYMLYGEVIKDIRRQLNITQEQLAHELNISFSTINRWENDRMAPSKLAKMRLIEYCLNNHIESDILLNFKKL